METRLIITVVLSVLVFIGCTHVDYQTLKIDNINKEISVINSNEFVIDSISITRFDVLYFSKSLENKLKGETIVSLDNRDSNYKIYIDSLSLLKCDTDNLSMDIIIRKKGSTVKVTKDIAMNFKHLDDIQTLRGLIYEHCSKQVDTIEAERRYR